MTREIKITRLTDRGAVAVEGADAEKLLQGLVTNDLALLETGAAAHAGLLSPQGKIQFEFFVAKAGPERFLLDVVREKASDLVKRLTLYKLRAAVTITNVSDATTVLALWGRDACSSGETAGTISVFDPRHPDLGLRILAEAKFADDIAAATNGMNADTAAYDMLRVQLGVPEGGRDYAFGDTFPHEALFDRLHGVSFTKGCYVGQEVVSRMEHRGTARKRIIAVAATSGILSEGVPVTAGEVEIGRIGTVAGDRALAMLRLDRVEEFVTKGVALTAGQATLAIDIPDWARAAPVAHP